MTENDHLDRETSLSIEVTKSAVSAKAKSRFVAAIDRLGGNLTETINVWLEEKTSLRRVRIDGERSLIEAAVRYGQDKMQIDNAFAERILESQFRKIAGAQQNKDGVLFEAIQDLRREPPTQSQATDGPEELSPDFMNRFEFYAEGATTDQLRERWGRVLASEIRKPGIFTAKALRIVDELDSDVARIFESVCTHRLGNVLPVCLTGELSFNERTLLNSAGLILFSSLGHIRQFGKVTRASGTEIWFSSFGEYGIGFLPQIEINENKHFKLDDPPSIDVYILTDVGAAIAEILPNNQTFAFARLFHALASMIKDGKLECFTKPDGSTDWHTTTPPIIPEGTDGG